MLIKEIKGRKERWRKKEEGRDSFFLDRPKSFFYFLFSNATWTKLNSGLQHIVSIGRMKNYNNFFLNHGIFSSRKGKY